MSRPEELIGWPARYVSGPHRSTWDLPWRGLRGKIVGTVMLGTGERARELGITPREGLVFVAEPPADAKPKTRRYLSRPIYVQLEEIELL